MSAADGPSCVLHRGGTENPVVFATSTTYMAAALAVLLALCAVVFRLLTARREMIRGAPWDGGLRRLFPQITKIGAARKFRRRCWRRRALSPELHHHAERHLRLASLVLDSNAPDAAWQAVNTTLVPICANASTHSYEVS